MIFDSWTAVIRLIGFGTISYLALIAVLRISGKRTLSKMYAFDLVITVAMGSTLATILLSKEVALVEGLTALALLVLLQLAITWTSVRSNTVRRWVVSEPKLVFHRGVFLRDAMLSERITEAEILAAMRTNGLGSVKDVGAVVLETDGTLSAFGADGLDSEILRGVE